MEEFIKHHFFDDEGREMAGLNNVKVQCGIFTNDPVKAENKLIEIMDTYNDDEIKAINLWTGVRELILKNGECYIWIPPIQRSRGYRCKKALIDKDLICNEDYIEVITHVCMYCGKNDVEFF